MMSFVWLTPDALRTRQDPGHAMRGAGRRVTSGSGKLGQLRTALELLLERHILCHRHGCFSGCCISPDHLGSG